MRLVIADISPIRYLAQIGQIELLHRLFESVSIPREVAAELNDPSAPAVVQSWIQNAPVWLKVRESAATDDPALKALDPGERSAIELGMALNADLILIDERRGSAVAVSKGFETTGTLGILDLAARRGLIDLRDAIEQLKRTNFRYRQEIIDQVLSKLKDRQQ
jgi:predicted nucleic acid-binding protein